MDDIELAARLARREGLDALGGAAHDLMGAAAGRLRALHDTLASERAAREAAEARAALAEAREREADACLEALRVVRTDLEMSLRAEQMIARENLKDEVRASAKLAITEARLEARVRELEGAAGPLVAGE